MGYFYSAADMVAGWNSHAPWNYDTDPVDRLAHGNVPWVDYYLQQMQQYEQQNGVRLLDVLDVHGYLTPAGIAFGEAGGGSDALRLTSTRVLWDPDSPVFRSGDQRAAAADSADAGLGGEQLSGH